MQGDANLKSKIELLLKDGYVHATPHYFSCGLTNGAFVYIQKRLWAQAISIFPHPTGEEGELDLLYKLWTEIEKADPAVLDHFLPSVSRYIKRYYQEFKVPCPFRFCFLLASSAFLRHGEFVL